MLERFLSPGRRNRRRPANLTYALNDRPPKGVVALVATQHAIIALTLVLYVVVAARLAGLEASEARFLITGSLLAMGFGTILQAIGGRYGSGLFIVHITDPFMLTLSAFVLKAMGPVGMVFIAATDGLTQLLTSRVFARLRVLLPPTVAGVVVFLGGLSLVESAITSSLGLSPAHPTGSMTASMVSLASLATIMACSIWGTTSIRLFSLFAGLSVGVALSALMGWVPDTLILQQADWIALPEIMVPDSLPHWSLMLPIALISALGSLDTMGVVVLMDKMDDADWRRPDMEMAARGLRAGGLANLAGALFGALPSAPSSANVGLCHASRTSSRIVALTTGVLIALIAFFPVISSLLTSLPEPVLGAIQVYASAYLITSGMEIICGRTLDSRGIFMVGSSIVLGLGILLMPNLNAAFPTWLQLLTGNAMASGGLLAIGLNLIFRLGAKSRIRIDLPPDQIPTPRELADLIERQCGHWATRKDVTQRATHAALESAEALAAIGAKPRALEGAFDEFTLSLSILHEGPPLVMMDQSTFDPTKALEQIDEDPAAALQALNSLMIRRLATKVSASQSKNGLSRLDLSFEH
ncbi:uracil-xanthine permease family protein [Rhodospirillum sp. A1_3_36]|uniref:uracil-xanthine permease family protein n=1 Tax=Rhodospirillum sp. A1_3_36 TaxID=3391666 RepID=UPI0039A78118